MSWSSAARAYGKSLELDPPAAGICRESVPRRIARSALIHRQIVGYGITVSEAMPTSVTVTDDHEPATNATELKREMRGEGDGIRAVVVVPAMADLQGS